MNNILELFLSVSNYLAITSMFLPIAAVLYARERNAVIKKDIKLFEIYVYVTLILQISALVLSYGFKLHNLFLFRIYLPMHTAFFSYFLLKWLLVKNKNIILLVSLFITISILGDFFIGKPNVPPNFMIWFDAILLFGLSFLLSIKNDKRKVHLPKENNFIHIGIYLYSTIALVGLLPSIFGLEVYGFFLQAVAVIISNYFFARSFLCLFPSHG